MSLVDQGEEPPNIKMAQLRQSLTGSALEAIRGLGVTQPEYEEAKEILETRFGGDCRKLQAYMDWIEKMPPLRNNDVHSLLYSLLVKKFADSQVESYSCWLREHKQERSVLSLRDWLKEEVRIRVEAVEMAPGIAAEPVEVARASGKRVERGGGSRTLFSTDNNQRSETLGPTPKPPCVYRGDNRVVWSCRRFQSMGVDKRWEVAKNKRLCFRCLSSNREGKDCTRARACDINGCRRNHNYLLHDTVRVDLRDEKTVPPWEGAPTRVHIATSKQETVTEAYSLHTVPVWLKANDRKVKVNAILVNCSNETFLNEEIAGILGRKERYQTVTVNVLNNEVETFQSVPLEVTVESLDGEFSEDITVKTCPLQS